MPRRESRVHIGSMGKLEENLRREVVTTQAEVIHDLNNLLGAIVSAASVLQAQLPAEGNAAELANDVRETAERAAKLVRRALVAARRERERARSFDLSAIVRAMEPLLRCVAGERVSLTVESSEFAGEVLVDRERLENVVVNLVANARDATPLGGDITVSTTAFAPRDDGASYATITVADTGAGMTADVRERIFEPFVTTKPLGRGAGLGLPSAQRFASESGGTIVVHSELNRGTAVVLCLPLADGP